jgi:hypothetical protein
MVSFPAPNGLPEHTEKETAMLKKTVALAALSAAALLGATPALADGYGYRHGHAQKRVVVVQQRVPYHAQRRVVMQRPVHVQRRVVVQRPVHVQRRAVVHRPVVVHHQPAVVYRTRSSHDVLGGLIVGAVLGAVIASHGGY